jgi:hypothetical protein
VSPVRDRSPVWIGLADLLLCVVSVVIVAVNPPTPKAKGVETKAEYLITAESSPLIDADPDIHVMPPSKHPVFYGSRDIGCAKLDGDPRGFMDNRIRLADGSYAMVETEKETVSLRCIEPGHYDVAENLYDYREGGLSVGDKRRDLGLKVHLEIVALNPEVHVLFAKDVILDWIGQTINVVSFDMGRGGSITLVDPPLEPITKSYQKRLAEP